MRKSVCVLLCILSTALSGRISAQNVIAQSETTIPVGNAKDNDLLHPDFAYPQNVIKTAEAFLAANPVNDPNSVLAVSEIVTARNSIDTKDQASNLQLIFDLVDKTTDKATRSMLWLYGSRLCQHYASVAGWSNIRVGGTDVSKWVKKDYEAAGDSLYMLALDNAPADVPLSRYADVLEATPQAYSLLPSVRDFVLYSGWYNEVRNSDDMRKKVIAESVEGSPLWFYVKARNNIANYYSDRYESLRDFICENLGKPGSEYAVYVFATEAHSWRKIKNNGDFVNKLAEKYRYTWVSDAVNALLDYCNQPHWTLSMTGSTLPGDTARFMLVSTMTDSIEFELLHYAESRIDVPKLKPNPVGTTKLKFTPRSGYANDTACIDVVNLPGNYFLRNSAFKTADRLQFAYSSMPWQLVNVTSCDGMTLMSLDARTGLPVKGIEVVYTTDGNKKEKSVVTDKKGLAQIPQSKSYKLLKSREPKSGVCFNADSYWINGVGNTKSAERNLQSNLIDFQIEFDRPVYRPGDTVRWLLVATDRNKATASTIDQKVEIYLPKAGGGTGLIPDTTFTVKSLDRFGRCEGSYTIPDDAEIGSGYFEVDYDEFYFKVSDFKLPDVNLSDIKTELSNDSVLISGRVTNSANAGRSGISVCLSINYPDSTVVDTLTSGNNGVFSLKAPRTLKPIELKYAKTPLGNSLKNYRRSTTVHIEAVSPDGRRAEQYTNFESLLSSSVSISAPEQVSAKQGANITINVTDYVPRADSDSLSVRWVITKPDSTVVLSGRANPGVLQLTPAMLGKVKNGSYRIWAVSDNEPSQYDVRNFICYNTDQTELPVNQLIWVPEGAKFNPTTGKAELTVGAKEDDTYLWWCTPSGKSGLGVEIEGKKLSKGFTTIEVTVPDSLCRQGSVRFDIWTVKKGLYRPLIYFLKSEESKKETLSLSLESFRDRLIPGAKEKWQFVTRIGATPVSAAVFANLYNSQLDFFGGIKVPSFHKPNLNINWFDLHPGFGLTRNWNGSKLICQSKSTFNTAYNYLLDVRWKYFLNIGDFVKRAQSGRVAGVAVNNAVSEATVEEDSAVSEEFDGAEMAALDENVVVTGYGTMMKSAVVADVSPLNSVQLRVANVLNAVWAPMLTTDATTGAVDVEFSVPNQSSTWVLKAVAWTTDLQSATCHRIFEAVKPVIVAPNPPRFVRVGDTVNLVTAITNTTDSVADISYSVSVGDSEMGGTVRLDGGATRYVTTPVSITGDVALKDSLALTVRATNGVYGDGERVAVPVLPSTALVVESRNFYLNPKDEEYTAKIPAEADSESELHFTANPMWVVVESLPSVLSEPCFEVATSYSQSLYVAKTALKIAGSHPAAKSTIDVDAARKALKTAVDKLTALQGKDGGLRWGQWQGTPSVYATLNFLNWMDQDTDDGDIKKLVKGALEYVDQHIADHGASTNRPDLYYAYVRSAYGTPSTLAGREIIDATLNYVRKEWRGLNLSDKALAVILLYRTGNKALAKTILESVSQFGKVTADRGMVFPNMPGITGYANLLEAYGLVLPDATETDAIRQGLVVQRRGASWGKTAHTSYAVRAMVNTGTDWTVPAEAFRVSVDGQPVAISPESKLTGAVSVAVKGNEVTIDRTAGVPAYGAVVTRRVAPLSDIPAFSDGEVTIEKNLYRKDSKGNYVLLTNDLPKSGEKVTVRLTLSAQADMTDLIVTDLRPAAFEPVDQTGRYSNNGTGLWFYLANRDTQTEIYIDRLPRGRHIVEYEVTVNNTGTYTTGMATITSGLDPDLTAHSASTPLTLPE